MSKFDHVNLIHKALTGQITPAEQLQLDNWLKAAPGNAAIAQEVEVMWEVSSSVELYDQEHDVEMALSRFQQARKQLPQEHTASVRQLSPRQLILRLAVAASLLLGVFLVWHQLTPEHATQLVEINTTTNQHQVINLTDGSNVVLNTSSYLSYPNQFNSAARHVELKGEAFFTITDDPSRPFSVSTADLIVQVIGTSFNIYAYPEKNVEEVVVESGIVKVQVPSNATSYQLEAGDRLRFNRKEKQVTITTDIPQNAQAWRTGNLTFDDTPMPEVCEILEKYFDITIRIENERIKKCTFTAPSFKNPTEDVVFDVLRTAMGLEITQPTTNTYLVSGNCD